VLLPEERDDAVVEDGTGDSVSAARSVIDGAVVGALTLMLDCGEPACFPVPGVN
jgi:hypothetical protein